MNIKKVLKDMIDGFAEVFSSFAQKVKEVLGSFRNHENKFDSDNVCTAENPCIVHRAMDEYEELGGDSMVGFYHTDCGTIQLRKNGVICTSCGRSFKVMEK